MSRDRIILFYANKILDEEITIENVPLIYRDEVLAKVEELRESEE